MARSMVVSSINLPIAGRHGYERGFGATRRLTFALMATLLLVGFVSPVVASADDPFSPLTPPGLCCQGMAFFGSSVNRVFMYGGLNGNATSEQVTYKWNWLHSGWESGSTGTPPQGKRSSTRMDFFGGAVNVLVLFGGQDCEPTCTLSNNHTYTFDGMAADNWIDCSSCDNSIQGIPDQRTSEGLAFGPHDPLGNPELVLFGGDNHSGPEGSPAVAPLQDTWTLQGTALISLNWVPCTSSSGCSNPPPNRGTPGMDFDSRTSNAVVFGGSGLSGRLGDTWLFNTGSSAFWSQCTTTACTQPPPNMQNCSSSTAPPCSRYGDRMVFYDDGTNYGSFMFGASTPQLLNDVWFFKGGATTGTWTKCTTKAQGCDPSVTPPEPRCCFGLAFDSSQTKILLYGAQITQVPEKVCADTWSWSVSQGWKLVAGTACA